jgi:hypothetical protein
MALQPQYLAASPRRKMKAKKIGIFFSGMIFGIVLVAALCRLYSRTKVTKVHTLKAPLILLSNEHSKDVHLLPAGTTLYFDQSFPEGFTRYKVYINIDRMPLPLRDLADPTEVDPIEARSLSKSELAY